MYAHVSGSTSGSTLPSKYEPEAEGKVEGVVYELFCVTRIVEKYSVFNTKSTSNQHGAVEKISTGCIDKNAGVWYNIYGENNLKTADGD